MLNLKNGLANGRRAIFHMGSKALLNYTNYKKWMVNTIMDSKHILIIEDDERMASMLQEYLSLDGYQVTCIHRKPEFYPQLLQDVDIVLLDLMLGQDNGLELLKSIREISGIPVIVVSAKSEDADKLIGFQLGADDYLCKPYNHLELVARIQAVLRRTQPITLSNLIKVNALVLDVKSFTVAVNDTQLNLTGLEFNILKQMMMHKGEIVTRDEIYQHALTQNREFESRTLDVHISNLRRKIGEYKGQSQIKTVRGKGYVLLDLNDEKTLLA